MGRLLDLLFPNRVHERKQREENALRVKESGEKIDRLRSLVVRTEAIHSKRSKGLEELMLKLLSRMDEIDKRLDAIERKIENSAAKGRPSDEVSAKQVLSEYLFGENGDE